MASLQGKSVIVTGGSSGIGRAAVKNLCAAGALVTVADLNASAGTVVMSEASAAGGTAQFVLTDVSSEDGVKAMVAAAVSRYGKLDGAINAAGVLQHYKRVAEISAAEWDFVLGINLRGMFFCVKHEIAAMLKSGGGAIVAIASIAANLGFPMSGEYCASKAGVTGLVRAAAIDYAAANIRVNALLPGSTKTPMVDRALATRPKELGGPVSVPSGRMADPMEVAAGAVWMISDEASFMNGSSLTLDGGMSIV
jgi:2,5-dichloro-2,5-cyclohexadiene-1,4-diol dehydrogenase 1